MASRPLAPTTTNPAKMGEEMAYAQATNAQSPNLKSVAKGGSKSGAPVGTKSQPGRRNIQERLGAQFAPQMTLYVQNAAEASQTLRNTHPVPSAVGNRDFFLRRQYGQTGF
jgi:hypothetical protein